MTLCVDSNADQPKRLTGHSPAGVRVSHATFQKQVTEIPPKPNHVWRKTQDGWQQIPVDPKPLVHYMEFPEERPRIHPFSVASLTLLLAMATMAWASNEWDWERFVAGKEEPCDSCKDKD